MRRDHPRVCGEKLEALANLAYMMGSPPRVRGKDGGDSPDAKMFGITPAYAGKSSLLLKMRAVRWDHPRVCGEKGQRQAGQYTKVGSPPRVRGKANGAKLEVFRVGITPAYAGKSAVHSEATPNNRDHPRVCGEK